MSCKAPGPLQSSSCWHVRNRGIDTSSRIWEGGHMAEVIERLKVEVGQLPTAQRAELAHFLLLTLEDGEDEGAEAAWDVELQRRLADIQSRSVQGRLAEEVFARIQGKHS